MNEKSVEIGWLLPSFDVEPHGEEALFDIVELRDDEIEARDRLNRACDTIRSDPYLSIETHPWDPNYVFVSFAYLPGGPILDEPTASGLKVREIVAELQPSVEPQWGVIHTER